MQAIATGTASDPGNGSLFASVGPVPTLRVPPVHASVPANLGDVACAQRDTQVPSPTDHMIYYTPIIPESVVSVGMSEQTPKRIYDTHPILAEIPPTQLKTGLFRSG